MDRRLGHGATVRTRTRGRCVAAVTTGDRSFTNAVRTGAFSRRRARSARTAPRPRASPPRGARSRRPTRSGSAQRRDRPAPASSACSAASAASISRSSRCASRTRVLRARPACRLAGFAVARRRLRLRRRCRLRRRRAAAAAAAASSSRSALLAHRAGSRPSRPRSCAARRPRSRPCASRRRRAARGRARRAGPSRRSCSSASSSASRLSTSRWFVGSSRISTFAPECTRIASDSRWRSPPERPGDRLLRVLAGEQEAAEQRARLVRRQSRRALRRVEHACRCSAIRSACWER